MHLAIHNLGQLTPSPIRDKLKLSLKSNRIYISVSVCMYRRISLTAEPVWFPFTFQYALKRIITIFGEGITLPREIPT